MTPQALFHMKPGSLAHRFVVAGERSQLENDERADATRALREEADRVASADLTGGRLYDAEDELGDLGRSFERMAASLRATAARPASKASCRFPP